MYKQGKNCQITYIVQNHFTLETDKMMLGCKEFVISVLRIVQI
jgi:hypothetical protein